MDNQTFNKQCDAGSYDEYAAAYDRFVRLLAGPLAQRICEIAQLEDGDRVLDVGTGSGLAAREAARVVAPSGYVLGVDLSKGMIGTAGKSQKSAPLEFRIMDAESLELPDASFDAVICLCAVLHFPNISTAIAEMYRVLKPGGRLVVSFGYARPISTWPLLKHFTKELIRKLLQPIHPGLKAPVDLTKLISSRISPPKEAMKTEWSEHQPHKRLFNEVQLAGFKDLKSHWLGHEVYFDSSEEFWEAQISIVTVIRKRLKSASVEIVDELRQRFLKSAQIILNRGGDLIYPYGAFYISAVRPKS